MGSSNYPFVSIIIPVYNDEDQLKLCLSALSEQQYEQSRYEIIVVDNGSENPEGLQSIIELHDRAYLTKELAPGSYAARNKGIDMAKGEIIAFTDADCIPAPDWLPLGVEMITTSSNCGLVGGQIQMFFLNPEQPTLVELYETVMGLPQQRFIKKYHYGATANVFTTRQVIDKVGKFDAQLKSSGDLEWGQRVHAAGYRQVYAESVIVKHPTHTSFTEFYTRTKRLAGGHYDLQRKRTRTFWQHQFAFIRMILRNLAPPVFLGFTILLDDKLKKVSQKIQIIIMLTLVGYVSAGESIRLKFGGMSSRT